MKFNLMNKLILFCAGLILARIIVTGNLTFIFLLWNIFLAWLPWFLIRKWKQSDIKIKQWALLLLSILFLPNAPYIITDLFHLKKQLEAPLWFDLLLILSCALSGMIYFFLSLERILSCSRQMFPMFERIWKPILFLACGYGIYLGRYLRFNSWDIFLRPATLAERMVRSVTHEGKMQDTVLFTITFALFLYLFFEIYLSCRYKADFRKNELPPKET